MSSANLNNQKKKKKRVLASVVGLNQQSHCFEFEIKYN